MQGPRPQPAASFCVRERERQEPPGPAAETQMRWVAFAGLVRTRGAMSPCRVPRVPREVTAAPCSGAPYATAMVSVWTSLPRKSVRDCDSVDLRVFWVEVATSRKLTRVTSGVNLPPLEVIMSRPRQEKDHTEITQCCYTWI